MQGGTASGPDDLEAEAGIKGGGTEVGVGVGAGIEVSDAEVGAEGTEKATTDRTKSMLETTIDTEITDPAGRRENVIMHNEGIQEKDRTSEGDNPRLILPTTTSVTIMGG